MKKHRARSVVVLATVAGALVAPMSVASAATHHGSKAPTTTTVTKKPVAKKPVPRVPKRVATSTISGRVTLASKPTVGVSGIEVMASAHVKPEEVYFAVTKANGDYLIMGLAPATYSLTFVDFPHDRGQNKVGYLPRAYSGTPSGVPSVATPPSFKVGAGVVLSNMNVQVSAPVLLKKKA